MLDPSSGILVILRGNQNSESLRGIRFRQNTRPSWKNLLSCRQSKSPNTSGNQNRGNPPLLTDTLSPHIVNHYTLRKYKHERGDILITLEKIGGYSILIKKGLLQVGLLIIHYMTISNHLKGIEKGNMPLRPFKMLHGGSHNLILEKWDLILQTISGTINLIERIFQTPHLFKLGESHDNHFIGKFLQSILLLSQHPYHFLNFLRASHNVVYLRL